MACHPDAGNQGAKQTDVCEIKVGPTNVTGQYKTCRHSSKATGILYARQNQLACADRKPRDSFDEGHRKNITEARERRMAATTVCVAARAAHLSSCRPRIGLHSHLRVHNRKTQPSSLTPMDFQKKVGVFSIRKLVSCNGLQDRHLLQ